jgi:hypothetical protein
MDLRFGKHPELQALLAKKETQPEINGKSMMSDSAPLILL